MAAETSRTLAAPGRTTGTLLVTAAAVLWSTGGLIVRLLPGVDSWTIVFWRSATAFLFLFVLGFALERGRFPAAVLRMGLPGLVIALCYTVASVGLVVALKLTSVADVLILMSCAPLLAAMLGRIVLGERLSVLGWTALAISVAGASVMVSDSYARGNLAGDLVALAMACALAIATVTFRRHRDVSLIPGVCLAALLATLLVLPFAKPWPLPLREAGMLTFFGAGQLGLGLAMFASGARLIPAAQTAMLGVLEPVIGPVWVWLVLGEQPSPMGMAGGAVVLAALMLFALAGLWDKAGKSD